MPSRDEIVDQITKAADIFEMIGIEFLGKKALKDYADKMRKSAAQVSAMRCGECKYYKDASRSGEEWCTHGQTGTIRNQSKDFGCFHHEKKPAG